MNPFPVTVNRACSSPFPVTVTRACSSPFPVTVTCCLFAFLTLLGREEKHILKS